MRNEVVKPEIYYFLFFRTFSGFLGQTAVQEMRFLVTIQPSLVVLSQNQPRNAFFDTMGPMGP